MSEAPTMKKCAGSCGIEKPLTEFHRSKRAKDGHQGYCKVCNTRQAREKQWVKYGIEIKYEHYEEMVRKQDGCCMICGEEPAVRELAVDHDHETGRTRDLLCHNCNAGLGHFRDDPNLLDAALDYLVLIRER